MRECFLWEDRCECNLKNGAYIVGWLGAIYRTLAIFTIAIKIRALSDDEELYITFYSVLLTYCFISLLATFIFIVGISKKKKNYLVPYLGIYGIEILALIGLLIKGVVIIIVKGYRLIILAYLIPGGVVFIGAYTFLWYVMMRLYDTFKTTSQDTDSNRSESSDSHFFINICSCLKSESFDVNNQSSIPQK